MALYVNGKKVVNSLVVDGHTWDSRLWILNPTDTDAAAAVSSQTQANYMSSFVSYISKINQDDLSNDSRPIMGRKQIFNGSSQACAFRGGYQIGGVIFSQKVVGSRYKKLYIYVQVTAYGTGTFQRAYITLSDIMGFLSDGRPSSIIKSVILVDSSKTPAEINSQTDVVISSTNSSLLSAQVVEIDISEINEDFYIGFWNCDRNIAIRSIYLE